MFFLPEIGYLQASLYRLFLSCHLHAIFPTITLEFSVPVTQFTTDLYVGRISTVKHNIGLTWMADVAITSIIYTVAY